MLPFPPRQPQVSAMNWMLHVAATSGGIGAMHMSPGAGAGDSAGGGYGGAWSGQHFQQQSPISHQHPGSNSALPFSLPPHLSSELISPGGPSASHVAQSMGMMGMDVESEMQRLDMEALLSSFEEQHAQGWAPAWDH